MIKVIDFLQICDGFNPVWINNGSDCEYYANSIDALETATAEELTATIQYFTLDGNGNITIET